MHVKYIRLMRVFGCYGKLPVSLGQINFGQVFRLVETSEEVLLIGDTFSIKFRNMPFSFHFSVLDATPMTTIFS